MEIVFAGTAHAETSRAQLTISVLEVISKLCKQARRGGLEAALATITAELTDEVRTAVQWNREVILDIAKNRHICKAWHTDNLACYVSSSRDHVKSLDFTEIKTPAQFGDMKAVVLKISTEGGLSLIHI